MGIAGPIATAGLAAACPRECVAGPECVQVPPAGSADADIGLEDEGTSASGEVVQPEDSAQDVGEEMHYLEG
eukprot:6752280-Alexandrium_andersonii.AAC.1